MLYRCIDYLNLHQLQYDFIKSLPLEVDSYGRIIWKNDEKSTYLP